MSQSSDDIFLRIEDALGQWSSQISHAHDQLTQQLSRAKERVDVPDSGATSTLRKEMAEIKEVLLAYHEAAKAQSEQIHRLTESVRDLYGRLDTVGAPASDADLTGVAEALDSLQNDVSRLERDVQQLAPVREAVRELRSLVDRALAQQHHSMHGSAEADALDAGPLHEPYIPPDEPQQIYAFDGEGKRRRMGEILVEARLITPEQLEQALAVQESSPHQRLGAVLVDLGMASSDTIAEVVAAQLQLSHIRLDVTPLDPPTVHRLPSRLAQQHKCIPVEATDNEMVLAMANPLDLIAIEDIERATNLRVVPVVASLPDIEDALSRFHAASPDQA